MVIYIQTQLSATVYKGLSIVLGTFVSTVYAIYRIVVYSHWNVGQHQQLEYLQDKIFSNTRS